MVDPESFDRRLGRLEETLVELRRVAGEGESNFLSGSRTRAATERWLQLATECTIDLAHQLIADRGWRTPETHRDAFQILEEHGAISPEMRLRLEGWAGLRNILVHLYTRVDALLVWKAVSEGLGDMDRFVAEITQFVR